MKYSQISIKELTISAPRTGIFECCMHYNTMQSSAVKIAAIAEIIFAHLTDIALLLKHDPKYSMQSKILLQQQQNSN